MIRKFSEKAFLITSDFLSVNMAFFIVFWFKFRSGLLFRFQSIPVADYVIPGLMSYAYWFAVFFLAGMYQSWYAQSRFDEMVSALKAVVVGMVVFYFTLFFSDQGDISSSTFLVYTISLFLVTASGRLVVRGIQRKLLIQGIGARNLIVIGRGRQSERIARDIRQYPALGLNFMGFVSIDKEKNDDGCSEKVIGSLDDLIELIKKYKIKDIIFAVNQKKKNLIFKIMSDCDGFNIDFYILPELYDIVAGHLKTNEIYGFPLVKLFPTLMSPFEEKMKRAMDVIISFVSLILSSPIVLMTALLVKFESKGPVIFAQERVGKDGRPFHVYKIRSMVSDAEKKSGPVWAKKNDSRITKVGGFIRKTRIDEIPQFVNILKGEMSLVGPRPERAFFVEKLKKEIPLYNNRLKVKPGLTGYAQVKHKYDASLEDVKEKLKYDLYYIENMSLRLDIKIILRTVFVVLFPGDRVH